MDQQKRQTVTYAVWGGMVIAVILLLSTVWVTSSARVGTRQAVDQVSEFYLEELAGRRAEVVTDELKTHFTYMENALGILEDRDLESQESLRRFLGRIKKLYDVDRFVLVDENGIVYTEHSTVSGLSRYSFLSEELTGPVVRTSNLYGARKQVILAVPVEDIRFQGARIKVCFTQVNIDEMLSSLTLKTSNTETWCNLYYQNGESLTDDAFGNLPEGSNLLTALLEADMGNTDGYEQLKGDFAEGRKGHLSFTYQGSQEDLCYVPVEGTGWMLTVLIRDNVISDQISSISSGMISRGTIQIIITVIVMLAVFLMLIHQSRKNAEIGRAHV